MEPQSSNTPNSSPTKAAIPPEESSVEPTTVKIPPSSKPTTTNPPSQPKPKQTPIDHQARSSSWLQARDEGLLHDVLEELDRERSRRAELEAQVRVLEDEVRGYRRVRQDEQRKVSSSASSLRTSRDYAALEAEKVGYLELLQALTDDLPSFRAASASGSSKGLPLHVVRLLEIMPWDERAQPYLFGQEQVYEWQVLSAQKRWQHDLKYFPTVFKTLPIVVPQPGNTVQETSSSSSSLDVAALLSSFSPPRQCVLTDLDVTRILNIDKGYPLPQDGGQWQWIGGWRIEKSMDTDENGWSYSNATHLPSTSSNSTVDFSAELQLPEPGKPNFVKRRRKWTRARVLVAYPHASTSSQEYLKLVSQRATLTVSVEKLSEQLVDTKVKLTTLEEDHIALREQATRAVSQMGKDTLKDKEQLQLLLESLRQREVSGDKDGTVHPQPARPGSLAAKGAPAAAGVAQTTVNLTKQLGDRVKQQQVLGWTKDQGSQLLEKFKQSGASDWTKDQGNQLLEKLKQQTTGGVTQGVVDKWKSWPKTFHKQDSNTSTSPSHSQHGSVAKASTAVEPAPLEDPVAENSPVPTSTNSMSNS